MALLLVVADSLIGSPRGNESVLQATGCSAKTVTFTFSIFNSMGRIRFGTKVYADGDTASIKVGCSQSYVVETYGLSRTVSFFQWATTTDGQFANTRADSTTFLAGTTGGAIELVLSKGMPFPDMSYGGYTRTGNTMYRVSTSFNVPSVEYVSGGDGPSEIGIGLGLGGINGRGWFTFVIVQVDSSGSMSFAEQSFLAMPTEGKTFALDPFPDPFHVPMSTVQVGDKISIVIEYVPHPSDQYLYGVRVIVNDETSGSRVELEDDFLQNAYPFDTSTVEWMAADLRDCYGDSFSIPWACHTVPRIVTPITFTTPSEIAVGAEIQMGLLQSRGTGVYTSLPLDIIPGFLAASNSFSIFYQSAETAPPSAPGTPQWLAHDEADGTIHLFWGAASDADSGVLQYELQQQTAGSSWSRLDDKIKTPSYWVYELSPGSYNFRVRSVDRAGNWGPFSGIASVTVPPRDTTPPSKPGTPSCPPGDPADGTFTLSWTASTDNAGVYGYEVQEQVGGGVFVSLGIVPTNAITLTRNPGTYSYQVRAYDYSGNIGPYSDVGSVVVPLPDTVPPTAPGVPWWPGGDEMDGTFTLTWDPATDNVGVTAYQVEERVVTTWSAVALVASNSVTLTRDTGAYYYRVHASDAAGNWGPFSGTSNPVVVPSQGSVALTLSYDATIGMITLDGVPAAPGVYNYNSGASVVAFAGETDPCYYFWRWSLDSQSLVTNPLTIAMNGNHVLSASFRRDKACGAAMYQAGITVSSFAAAPFQSFSGVIPGRAVSAGAAVDVARVAFWRAAPRME